MHGQVEARERLVEAETPDDRERVLVLGVHRPRAGHERIVAVDGADLGDQGHELGLEVVEDRPHLGRLHPGLEVVEQGVVRLVVAFEALDVAPLQLDRLLEVRKEVGVVGLLARLGPDVVRLGGGPRDLGRQLGRDAARFSQSRRVVRIRLASSDS